jgi:hypothetical protein
MLNLAKCAAVAAVAVGLGVAATKPASAWGYTWGWGYSCGDGCGYGYGAFGPFPYGFYPYPYGDDGAALRGRPYEPELPLSVRGSISPAPAGERSCPRARCGKSARPVR